MSCLLVLLITFLSTRGWFPGFVKNHMYGKKKEQKKAVVPAAEEQDDDPESVYQDAE